MLTFLSKQTQLTTTNFSIREIIPVRICSQIYAKILSGEVHNEVKQFSPKLGEQGAQWCDKVRVNEFHQARQHVEEI